ncbi:hypothetical protein ACLSSQ_11670 [Azospira sp. APE16]|uniref:hypothetical protein n=1 Tax=Azospira sp. APE16 TaxID=3394231 RepID=UPI003A4D2DA6
MTPGTPVRVTGHLPGRPNIAGYMDRTGTIQDSGATHLLEGFVAVALDYRDGSPPSKQPILTIFHQDELTVLGSTPVIK